MAKQIKGNEIIQDNHLDNAIKSGEEYLAVLKKINDQVVKNAKALKSANGSAGSSNSAKSIKAASAALTESQAKKKAVLKTDNDIIKAEQQLKVLRSDKVQKLQQLKILNQEQAKINKQQARETLGLVGAYEKESKLLIKLRKELKDLIIVEGQGSKAAKKLGAEVNKLDAKLKGADAVAGQFGRTVGNYKTGLRGGIASIKRLALAFGVFGGIQLVVKGLREMFNIVKNFDQGTADLAAVLGVTKDEMKGLTEQAMALGSATIFTAAQVSELQKSFAKLGFTQEEIKGVTQATLELAAATGSDLGQSATIVGSTLRAFGLDVSETQRVVDVMAKSFSASALDMEKFTVAMRTVAPVAKNAGFSIEETTSLLGTLVNAGVDASTAGSGLRKIFLSLAESGQTFEQAMSEINNSTDKNKTSLKLFGQRAAALGIILSESGVSADALTDKLENAGGAAKEMADKQLNTLGGAVKLLTSAWEGFILKMNDSRGAGAKLTKIIKFLAENLDTILNTVINATLVFAAYKVGVTAATIATRLFGEAGKKASKFFGGPMLAAIALVVIAVASLVDHFKNALAVGDSYNDVLVEVNETMAEEKAKLELVRIELAKTTAGTQERQDVLDKVNAEYGTTLKNLEDEAEFANQVADAYQRIVENLRKEVETKAIKNILVELTTELIKFEQQRDSLDENSNAFLSAGQAGGLDEVIGTINAEIADLTGRLIDLDKTKEKVIGGKGKGGALDDRFNKEGVDAPIGAVKELDKALDQSEIEEQARFDSAQQREKDKADQDKENSDIKAKNAKASADAIKKINDQQEKDNKARLDREKKAAEAALKQQKEFAQKTMDLVKQLSDQKNAAIDKEIEAKKTELSVSQTEIARLQALNTADANESIKAERVKQARDKIEIERLEEKKKNLLIVVTTLGLANNLIQQGDGNGLSNATGKMNEFLSNIPTFFDGTEGTVSQALGMTGTRDGHTVRVHDNEHIIGANDSSDLHAAGLTKNKDIVSSAIAYQNGVANKRALVGRTVAAFTDANIVGELRDVKKAIKNIKIVQHHYDLKSGREKIIDGNKTTNNDYNPNTFKI